MKTRNLKITLCLTLLLVFVLAAVSCNAGAKCEKTGAGHTYSEWSVDTATCTEGGIQTRKCTSCHYTEQRATTALGHQMEDVAAKAAGCDAVGWNAHTKCYKCGYSADYVEIAPKAHSLVSVSAKDPTCTEIGYNDHQACAECDYKEGYEETAALGHVIVMHERVEPTCTEKGTMAYITCERCDHQTPIIEIDTVAHTYGDWGADTATCDATGVQKRECAVCHLEEQRETAALGHDFISMPGSPATCTEAGYNPYLKCQREGCDYNTLAEVAAKGHSYGDWFDNSADCEHSGKEYRICKVCGEDVEERVSEPLGHTFGEWQIVTESTCQRRGTQKRDCLVCGYTENADVDVIDHNVEWTGDTATCLKSGQKTGYCTMCNLQFKENSPSTGHTFVWKYDTATCIEGGVRSGICSMCGMSGSEETEAIPHNFGDWSEDTATCDVGGEIKRVCKVDGCGYEEVQKTSALGHNIDWSDPVWPEGAHKCTTTGDRTGVCSVCNITFNEKVRYEEHQVAEWTIVTAPTCTVAGKRTGKCSVCEQDVVDVIVPTGHNFSEWQIDPKPTCTENGKQVRTCKTDGCGYTEEIVLLALGHNLSWTLAEGAVHDCATAAKYIGKCSDCEYTTEIDAEPKAHTVTVWKNSATCDNYGKVSGNCIHCGAQVIADSMPLGHSYGGWKVVVAPTCEQAGITERICNVCAYNENSTVPALGHSLIDCEAKESDLCTEETWYAYQVCSKPDCTRVYITGITIYTLDGNRTEEVVINFSTKEGEEGLITSMVYKGVTYTLYTRNINPGNGIFGYYEATKEGETEKSFNVNITYSEIRFNPTTDVTAPELRYAYESEWKYTTYSTQHKIPGNESHNIENIPAKTPTCGEMGWDAYERCTNENCAYTTFVEIPALGHNFEGGESFLILYPICSNDGCGEIKSEGEHTVLDATVSIQNSLEFVLSEDESYYILISARMITTVRDVADEEFLIIPSSYNGLPVKAIAASAFESSGDCKIIVIQRNMEIIDSKAFNSLSGLTAIVVQNNDTYVSMGDGSVAINLYRKDESVEGGYILVRCATAAEKYTPVDNEGNPIKLTGIDEYAFANCANLTEIVIPSTVKYIGANAFKNASNLAKVTFEANGVLTSIGAYAFASTAISEITVPDSVTALGDYVFSGCTSLVNAAIGSGVTVLSKTFHECSALKNVVIGVNVTNIDNGTFYACSSLETVTIPEGVVRIGVSAFAYCSSLKTIVLPKSVTVIENYAFMKCNAIEAVYYLGSAEEYAAISVGISNKSIEEKVYFYLETEPASEGNFWHYVTEGESKVIAVWPAFVPPVE